MYRVHAGLPFKSIFYYSLIISLGPESLHFIILYYFDVCYIVI